MRKTLLLLLFTLLVAAVTAGAAKAVTPLRPAPTPPDTESLLILHGAFNYPGYWWDHTDLTVAVQAHPNVDGESVEPQCIRRSPTGTSPCVRSSAG